MHMHMQTMILLGGGLILAAATVVAFLRLGRHDHLASQSAHVLQVALAAHHANAHTGLRGALEGITEIHSTARDSAPILFDQIDRTGSSVDRLHE